MSTDDALALARAYLLAARLGRDAGGLEARLARLDAGELAWSLADDDARKAFWIDLYNGVSLRHQLTTRRALGRLRHFRRPLVVVAGQRLSLDAIEHGLLRRSRWKLGLGFLTNPLPSRFERRQRVERLDPRVHFALNCGVASCPPIAAYDAEHLDAQLERATRSYLQTETRRIADTLAVPALLLWYLGDFGGPRGVRRLLRRHRIEGWGGRLRFRSYDWTPEPGRWDKEPEPWSGPTWSSPT